MPRANQLANGPLSSSKKLGFDFTLLSCSVREVSSKVDNTCRVLFLSAGDALIGVPLRTPSRAAIHVWCEVSVVANDTP